MMAMKKMLEQEPSEIELLLPWHAAGTLNPRDARRVEPQGLAPEDVEAFSKWVDERAGIAAQTASLAVGAQAAWK